MNKIATLQNKSVPQNIATMAEVAPSVNLAGYGSTLVVKKRAFDWLC